MPGIICDLAGSDEVEEAVRLRIKRYSLNIGLSFENRLILVDEGYISRMSKAVVERVKGELGIMFKWGCLPGPEKDKMVYMHNTPVCDKGSISDAEKSTNFHLINKKNGMSIVVVNWHRRGKHCYFTIVPTMLWQAFKALPKFSYYDIKSTHLYLRSRLDLKFMYLRKLHYNVMHGHWGRMLPKCRQEEQILYRLDTTLWLKSIGLRTGH